MADQEIKITFPEEKMEALVFFLGEQNEKVEDVLKAHLDKTYEKSVPAQVRKFVESRVTGREEAAQEQRSQGSGRGSDGGQRQRSAQGRRNGRRSVGQTTQEQSEPAQTMQEDAQTGPEEETEAENTMSMGM